MVVLWSTQLWTDQKQLFWVNIFIYSNTKMVKTAHVCTVKKFFVSFNVTEVEFSHPSIGPDVFCGIGLTVAVFGIASGVFWGVKGRYATPVL